MNSVLLDDSLGKGKNSLLFQSPDRVIVASTPQEVIPALDALEQALAQGYHAAGFFAYELGYLLEPRLAPLFPKHITQPLLWFGLFRTVEKLDRQAAGDWLADRQTSPQHHLHNQSLSTGEAEYRQKFAQAKAWIAAGDIYQLNLTFRGLFELEGCPYSLYNSLRENQPVSHGALIETPDFKILSLSPEQFVRIENRILSTRPMKGTIRRGNSPQEDRALCRQLFLDEKSRAENLMIVDLMRNDISKIARPGSVRVKELYRIEKYRTLFQMTSLVSARIGDNPPVRTLLQALFPAGSITGAPKMRAQEIIAGLETGPRGVYTGSIGHFSPNGDAQFNVAIRTIYLDNNGRGEIGIGAGLVSDSQARAEYQECLLKMSFLTTMHNNKKAERAEP